MSLIPQRATSQWKEWSPTPRWKEWLPLTTQQQRLRSMIQLAAYNVPWYPGSFLYFTLHETTMSPPFYTSERLQHQHPKWGEIEVSGFSSSINTSSTGVVVRLWLHQGQQNNDQVVLVWGAYFSGLVYLGPRLISNASHFNENTVVLHMQGGYFTDRHSLKELPATAMARNLSIMLPVVDTRPSYSVSLLLRLRNIQQAIKKLTQQSNVMKEKILAGGMTSREANISRESNPTLRKLLSKSRPKPQQRQETMAVLCQVEMLRFRVALLRQEKQRKLVHLESLQKRTEIAASDNADHSCELTERYQNLHKETEHLRDNKRHFADMRETFLLKNAQLSFRRKQLMSQLSYIYPVLLTDGKYTICGIHLPNSEELSNADDVSVSVALGFVAHLVQMVSIFLQVPLRYPIIHFGSRSKIVDHITEKIPDKEREFPLFARGKDKLQFHYGVYLLNKNIAQLRWQVGFPTNDLRATLHNVYHLLHLNQFSTLENHHRSMSGSSLDVLSSSVNVSPVGSVVSALGLSHGIVSPNQLRLRHRSSKSMGSSELLFPTSKRSGSYLSPPHFHHVETDGLAGSANLSYSLDKGLDEYEEIKRAEDCGNLGNNPRISAAPSSSTSNLAYVGSEPSLVIHSHTTSSNGEHHSDMEVKSSLDAPFLNKWEGKEGGATTSSEDEDKSSTTATRTNNKSEFTLVTERITKLIDSSKSFDIEANATVSSEKFYPEELALKDKLITGVVSDLMKKCDPILSEKVQCDTASVKKILCNDATCQHDPTNSNSGNVVKLKNDEINCVRDKGGLEVDVGTDALADILNHKHTHISDSGDGGKSQHEICGVQTGSLSLNKRKCDSQESEQNRMECVGTEESVLVDNLFASVTSRTEALASHTTSFNLMSSRHGST